MRKKIIQLMLLFLAGVIVLSASAQTWTKVDDRDASVTRYGSGWELWDGMIPGAYMDTCSTASQSGDYAIFSFTGIKVRLYGCKSDYGGNGNVYIDDVPDGTVSFYNSSDQGNVLLYESGALASGSHEFKVEWVSADVMLDAFEYEEGGAPDTAPPTPDPMTWAAVPSAISDTSISMTDTTTTDPSGVEYFFGETSGNPSGSDSGWQDPASYTDTGLSASTQYCYQVRARDKSVNQNLTGWSTNQCATTQPASEWTQIIYDDFEGGFRAKQRLN